MAQSSSQIATPRDDLGLYFESVDLESIRMGYVGFLVAPMIEAPLRRGRYSFRTIGQTLKKTQDATRTDEGRFNRTRSEFGEKTYAVVSRGLEEPVDHAQEAEFLGMIDSELIAAESTRHGVLEDHELRVIEKIAALTPEEDLSANSGAKQFDNAAADPVANFAVWKRNFRLKCGYQPNALLLDQTAVDQLAANPAVVEAAGRAGSSFREALEFNDVNRELRRQAIAVALGISEIVESGGIKNTAGAPLDSSLATTFAEDHAVLFIKDTGPNTRRTQWLRTAHWSGNGSRPGCAFEMYEEPQTDSTIIRHRLDTEILEINSEAVMLLDNVIDLTIFS